MDFDWRLGCIRSRQMFIRSFAIQVKHWLTIKYFFEYFFGHIHLYHSLIVNESRLE